MMIPQISVIMSAYKPSKQDLEISINSILRQTLQEFEFIIIKDDDLPETLLLLLEWTKKDSRIKILDNVKNLGLIASLNKGLDYAEASLIARIDIGDWWEPSKLEKQLHLFDTDAMLYLCGTSLTLIDSQYHPIGHHNAQPAHTDIMKQIMDGTNPFAHSSVMFRKTTLRYNPKALYCEDFELWCRYSQIGKLANINESLTHYIVDTYGITGQKRSLMIENTTKVYCSFIKALKKNDPSFITNGLQIIPKTTLSKMQKISNQWYSKAITAALNHQKFKQISYLFFAVLCNPLLIWNKIKRLYCKGNTI